MHERLHRFLPTREQIHGNRWLRWLGPYLHHPRLWHWSRRGVAMGVAMGVFFGLLVPIAQIPMSVTATILLRANVPAAVASTLVTNPLTFAPIYYAAYRTGTWIVGDDESGAETDSAMANQLAKQETRFWQRISSLGKPLLVGLALYATLAGFLVYALITFAWRIWVWQRRRRRWPR
jgi:uncharacterized protein (DUF2062 family)